MTKEIQLYSAVQIIQTQFQLTFIDKGTGMIWTRCIDDISMHIT